jgi:hypothetical protein
LAVRSALLCVGLAYFVIGVIVPIVALASQGGSAQLERRRCDRRDRRRRTRRARRRLHHLRVSAGGLPSCVMPIVFGGALS